MDIQIPVCLSLMLLLSVLNGEFSDAAPPPIARPDCPDTCGNVSIPFPFGVGSSCSLDPWFNIDYKASPNSSGSTKPFLSRFGVEVMELNVNDYNSYDVQYVIVGIPPLNVCSADPQPQQLSGVDLRGSPYNYSRQDNAFVVEGCSGSAALVVSESNETMAGCGTVCNRNNSLFPVNKCYGVQCCQMPLSSVSYDYFPTYQILFNSQESGDGTKNCLAAALIKSDSVNQHVGKLASSDLSTVFPVVLSWSWISNYLPSANNSRVYCTENYRNMTYCVCEYGYYGNPYVSDGCQVPEECKGCPGRRCRRKWDNTGQRLIPGSFECRERPPIDLTLIRVFAGITAIAVGPLLFVFGCSWLRRFIKRRSKTARRVQVFKQKLQHHQSTSEGVVERTKLFTHKQLYKATNHFNENRVLGKGGQGTVYKGMLDDGRTVAIKKLRMIDESEMEQFINEVVILSQINHRNVVKLLGCCLEREVPLLVYEFISNGTLSQHVHDPDEDFVLSWSMRLKIATGTAGAIAYLHSYSSIPIYHRDIKSLNILLDDKYKAKVSDFGSSKTTSIDQTHLTTLVRGTMGYLDPEYFQSKQFTEKSDVYSFGVVLLELLTGKKPIYRDETMEQRSLVVEFLHLMQNSQMFSILDPQVVKDAEEEELIAVANLAKRCISGSGRMRPTMKEVAMTLEMITNSQNEMPTQDQQSSQDEQFKEIAMAEISDADFMSSSLPAVVVTSLNIDVQP